MQVFMYSFGYETPEQEQNNRRFGYGDEDSAAVLIRAADASQALAWGNQVAEAFLTKMYEPDEVSWKARGYSSWVEPCNEDESDLPCIGVGEFPTFF